MQGNNVEENLHVLDDMPDVEIVSSCQNDPKVKIVQVPFARERKKSVYLQDPFTDPPPTTPRVRRKRKHKKTLKTLIGSDGKVIELQPWTEVHDLSYHLRLIYSILVLTDFVCVTIPQLSESYPA